MEGAKGTLSTCTSEAIAYDILLLTETLSVNSVEIPGFTCFCTKAIKSGKGRPQSGLAIALSKQLRITCNVLHQNNKLLALQIKEFSLIIIVAYFPPKTDLETIYQALTETFQCCQGKARMVLGGDFNCRLDSSERGNSLCEFLINWNLHCVNDIKEVTYEFQYGKSVIDLFFVSKELLEHFNEIKINNSLLTKHKPVSCCFDLKHRQDTAESRKKQMRKFDIEQLNERMKSVQNPHDSNALDTSYDEFAKAIQESATVMHERKSPKWFKRELYILHKQLKAGYRQRHKADSDYFKMKRAFKKLCRKHKMMHEIDRESFIIRKAVSERREFWKILKSKKVLTKVFGITIPVWESYFEGLFKAEGEISDKLLDEQTLGNNDYCFSNWKYTGYLNDPITLEEITDEASKLKAGKAAGPDGITNTTIKLGFHPMQRYVFHLFNLCFAEHNVPRIWKLSYIKPLYKGKGSKAEPSSYRGISLLCCMYKRSKSTEDRD